MNTNTASALRELGQHQPDLAHTLDRFFATVVHAASAEQNFAAALSDALRSPDPDERRPGQFAARGRNVKGRRPAGPFDPFECFASGGNTALTARLLECDIEQLKDIVAEHGMDYDRLALRWKSSSRLVERIVETVEARARKGDAFGAAPVEVAGSDRDELAQGDPSTSPSRTT